jgi:predicted AAA+ superfamily ATPase
MTTTFRPDICDRWLAAPLASKLGRPYIHILFGARQTGKSTLLKGLLPDDAFCIDLADPEERNRHLAQPGLLARQCRALPRQETAVTVFIDEAQTAPSVFDAVQSLYDVDKTRWRFLLCGSSARKLRQTGANLLPGRSVLHHLETLTLLEQPPPSQPTPSVESPLPFAWQTSDHNRFFPAWDIEERLAFGALPGIVTAAGDDRADLLRTYATVFLEEEIRREALVKDYGGFLRFLQLAAQESGRVVNFSAISRDAGISIPTIKSHYQLLEDMFVGFFVPGFSGSPRRNLLSTPRFFFFDLGIRHAAAGLMPGFDTARAQAGPLFEQWVGLELWKRLRYQREGRLHYLRTADGAEVDFIVEMRDRLIPIEVKWTDRPSPGDARHLTIFLREHPDEATHGWVVCRCPRPEALTDQVTAIPWWML